MSIYKVECRINGTAPDASIAQVRLIDAPNTAAAMRYAAGQWITVERCSTSEAVELGAQGVKIEKTDGAA